MVHASLKSRGHLCQVRHRLQQLCTSDEDPYCFYHLSCVFFLSLDSIILIMDKFFHLCKKVNDIAVT
jgi:hypothetical protein